MELVKIKKDKLVYAIGAGTGDSFSVPENVRVIGKKAFSGNHALRSISLPEGLEEIGDEAFADCTSLKEIYIPDSVKKIGDRVFRGCSSLEKVRFLEMDSAECGINCWSGCTKLREFVFGEDAIRVLFFPEEDTFMLCAPIESTDAGVELCVGKYAGENFPNGEPPSLPTIYVAFSKDASGREYWWYSLTKEDAVEGAYIQVNHETIRDHFGHLTLDTQLDFKGVAQICGFCLWGVISWCNAMKIPPDRKMSVQEILDLLCRAAPGAARRLMFVLEHQDEDLEVMALENHLTGAMLFSKNPLEGERLTIKW